jgi:hypothetical protein
MLVGSYPTVSPLPVPVRAIGGLLSVALSVGFPRPGVTWHPALWSPDFPQPVRWAVAARRTRTDIVTGRHSWLFPRGRSNSAGAGRAAATAVAAITSCKPRPPMSGGAATTRSNTNGKDEEGHGPGGVRHGGEAGGRQVAELPGEELDRVRDHRPPDSGRSLGTLHLQSFPAFSPRSVVRSGFHYNEVSPDGNHGENRDGDVCGDLSPPVKVHPPGRCWQANHDEEDA